MPYEGLMKHCINWRKDGLGLVTKGGFAILRLNINKQDANTQMTLRLGQA